MGVTNLWKILNAACEPCELNDLANKTLAIDLSIWICENSFHTQASSTMANSCIPASYYMENARHRGAGAIPSRVPKTAPIRETEVAFF